VKKLFIAAFLLFYAGFTFAMIGERTSSWASASAASVKSTQPEARGMQLPHASQRRLVEHPFVLPLAAGESFVRPIETITHLPSSEEVINRVHRVVLSRAPPSLQ